MLFLFDLFFDKDIFRRQESSVSFHFYISYFFWLQRWYLFTVKESSNVTEIYIVEMYPLIIIEESKFLP